MLNNLTFTILRLLADGRFQSGEAIAKQLGVSRATVWNAIQEAQSLGVEIFSVRGRGYRLPEAIKLLEREAVLDALGNWRDLFKLELHDTLDSTNSYLMKQASLGASHATVVAALLQTAGKGRRGRVWQAGLGASLTFSLLWRFQCGAAALSGLSLAVGLALIRTLHALGLSQTALKWPNDVLVSVNGEYRKLAGILIELQGDMDGPSAAVIGIGVNLHLPTHMREQIDQPVMDLKALLGDDYQPNQFLGALLQALAIVLKEFESNGFESLREEWMRVHAYQGKAVRMISPNGQETEGVVSGIALDGVLLVETALGQQRFSAGEISMRAAKVAQSA